MLNHFSPLFCITLRCSHIPIYDSIVIKFYNMLISKPGFIPQDFNASITKNESARKSSRDYSWSFDGLWTRHGEGEAFSITLDSDYDKTSDGGAELDRLKT